MSLPVIQVQNLSKRYRIGLKEQRHDTFAQQILATIKAPLQNFRQLRAMSKFGADDESVFWALKDINFEVQQGEVLGIIGHNGAGKSTLLKILSKITEPTAGEVRIKGRIAALLEVGTGFHQDLTGRENIYMNGTILGMSKKEIDRKLDEIIDFSGVEKYVDTPVKFYSSGMKVRLGFAVAAHLEPEILIIDEVLAVGDAEFQKKCLGKMESVAGEGRTVLFVSHDMSAIRKLTKRSILLKGGQIISIGETPNVVNEYRRFLESNSFEYLDLNKRTGITSVQIKTSSKNKIHEFGEPIEFAFKVKLDTPGFNIAIAFQLINEFGVSIINPLITQSDLSLSKSDEFELVCQIKNPKFFLGYYSLTVHLGDKGSNKHIETLTEVCSFQVVMDGKFSPYGWKAGNCIYIEEAFWFSK